jgi:hypothetical protein
MKNIILDLSYRSTGAEDTSTNLRVKITQEK